MSCDGDPTHQAFASFPGYRILEELGRGGMGVVYRARHVALNRDVALKMVPSDDWDRQNRRIRFLAEAEAVAAIRHPNVVQVFELGEHHGHPYMVMEYMEGGSLAEEAERASMPPQMVAELVQSVARGVAAAHEKGIVHRDLKPCNIPLRRGAVPKVTDFGLAKRLVASDVTRSGQVMGTPAYMSPEQASGDSKFVGPQADVWGPGVILYECLTGAPLPRPTGGRLRSDRQRGSSAPTGTRGCDSARLETDLSEMPLEASG